MQELPTIVVLLTFLLCLAVCLGACGLIVYLVNKHLAKKQGGIKNE